MKNHSLFAVCIISLVYNYTVCQVQDLNFSDAKEREIFECWQNNQYLKYDILECLLVAEGKADQIPRKNTWLNSLEKIISDKIDSNDSPVKKGKQLFRILQDRVLRKFSPTASAASLITNGEFSCVTSTALYYHFGSKIGIPIVFHAMPFHVCPVISYKGEKTWVELTDPSEGFDAEYDHSKFVRLLLKSKFITEEELHQKGEETIYEDFIKGHFQSSPLSILGYHYYNYALKLAEQEKPEETFWALAKANALEKEDEIIKNVFDVAFLSLSSQTSLSSFYVHAVQVYVKSRIMDTTITIQTISGISQAVSTLIDKEHDFLQTDSIMVILSNIPHRNSVVDKSYIELCQYVSINKSIELSRKGQYEDSFRMISNELLKDNKSGKLQDIYVNIGLSYIQKLLSLGKDELALRVVDTMYFRFPSYARLKDEYIRVLITNNMVTGKYLSNLSIAHKSLLKGYEMDSTNYYLRQALATVCHELAMSEIRKNDYRSARSYIVEGLKYIPDHEYLKSDLYLLQKALPKSKK